MKLKSVVALECMEVHTELTEWMDFLLIERKSIQNSKRNEMSEY